jgi:hypothetical protein
MPAVPITIVGTSTSGEATSQVTITGIAFVTGLEVGGGPVMPPQAPGHPAHPIYTPPGIWGGGDVPMPTPPIAPGGGPAHPIVEPPVPPMPEQPPDTSAGGGWVWSPIYGWVWRPAGSGGKPKPPDMPPVAAPAQ